MVVLGVHLFPHLVHLHLAPGPLLPLLLQAGQDDGEGHLGVAFQQVLDIQSVVAIDALHTPQVDGWMTGRRGEDGERTNDEGGHERMNGGGVQGLKKLTKSGRPKPKKRF